MSNNLFRILLTSAGTSTALGVIKGLRGDNAFEIHTTDINPIEMLPIGAFEIASHTQVPYATDKDNFIEKIESVISSKKINYIYPIHDEEIRTIASSDSDLISSRRSNFLLADIINCTDKLLASEVCQRNGIFSPKTITPEEFMKDPFYPAFTKPRIGVGSIGVKKIESFSDFSLTKSDIVIQELCVSPEITVDALPWNGKIIAVARERLEVKAGVSTKAVVFYSEELESIALKLSNAFNIKGIFCFQVMRCRDEWAVIDINPRSGGATAMTLSAGINLYREHFFIQAGFGNDGRFLKLVERTKKLRTHNIVRYYDEHISYIEGEIIEKTDRV